MSNLPYPTNTVYPNLYQNNNQNSQDDRLPYPTSNVNSPPAHYPPNYPNNYPPLNGNGSTLISTIPTSYSTTVIPSLPYPNNVFSSNSTPMYPYSNTASLPYPTFNGPISYPTISNTPSPIRNKLYPDINEPIVVSAPIVLPYPPLLSDPSSVTSISSNEAPFSTSDLSKLLERGLKWPKPDSSNQNLSIFENLRQKCKRENILYEDPDFSPSDNLLVETNGSQRYFVSYFGRSIVPDSSIQWLRPHEICQNLNIGSPKMFVGATDRFDINQGEIGDCWFLAALANLVENKSCFHRVCPPEQTFHSEYYAGIFHFWFWRFGEWKEVIIDDRLPTRKSQLIYLRSVEPNEFWGALLEKAYAKLHGSYRALEGGLTIEASVDFTGGIPEMISLDEPNIEPERLFYLLSTADERGAFMGSSLTRNSRRGEEGKAKGLQSRHAYTITKVISLFSSGVQGSIPLIRLRNPHGNDKEWKGDWSDEDRNWKAIPKAHRDALGLNFRSDGEFYMSFRDFLTYFGELELVHLTADASITTDSITRNFTVFHFHGQWSLREGTAGGCGNQGGFWKNPQFFFRLQDPNPYDDETSCSVIISVLQKSKVRKSDKAIGFKVFVLKSEDKVLDDRFFKHNASIDRTDRFINLREISKRCVLSEGHYCIVPCTFDPGEEGEFMIRIFVEKYWCSSESNSVDYSSPTPSQHPPSPNYPYYPSQPTPSSHLPPPKIPSDPYQKTKDSHRNKNKIIGFALKKLEKSLGHVFPGGAKGIYALRKLYSWTQDRDSEFDLLKAIVRTLK